MCLSTLFQLGTNSLNHLGDILNYSGTKIFHIRKYILLHYLCIFIILKEMALFFQHNIFCLKLSESGYGCSTNPQTSF